MRDAARWACSYDHHDDHHDDHNDDHDHGPTNNYDLWGTCGSRKQQELFGLRHLSRGQGVV
jgi:hypothetical protein